MDKKIAVLDIDHTLICSLMGKFHDDMRSETVKITIPGDGHFWMAHRPYCTQFLQFLQLKYEVVAVWSAGERDYVHSIVESIFDERPKVVLTRQHCEYHPSSGYIKNPQTLIDAVNLEYGAKYKVDDMTIFDDNEVLKLHFPNTTTLVRRYDPKTVEEIYADTELWNLMTLDGFIPDDTQHPVTRLEQIVTEGEWKGRPPMHKSHISQSARCETPYESLIEWIKY